MSVHYVYMHVNFTQYSHSLSMCCWPLHSTLCFGKLCVIACISWSLGIWQPNCWYGSPGSSAHLARTKVLPPPHPPVVVNTSVPLRSPSASSTQDTVVSSSPYSLMFHSVGDFKVNKWEMHTCACTPPPTPHPPTPRFHNTHLATFQSFS